VYTKLSTRLQI